MSKVQLAKEIARRAHKGQVDKAGVDYIQHPLRVHRNLRSNPTFKSLSEQDRDDCEVGALLHDVIEDSGQNGGERFGKQELIEIGFTPNSIHLVELLTRPKSNPNCDDYYLRINENLCAKLIKWADIADNRNVYRVTDLTMDQDLMLTAKYDHALSLIPFANSEEHDWFEEAKRYNLEV